MYPISSCFGGAGSFNLCDGKGTYPPMVFIGASVPVSALPGEVVYSLTVYPRKGEKGVVAVASDYVTPSWAGAISLDWNDSNDKLLIEQRSPFFNPDRIGQVYSSGHNQWVEVQIEGDRFTSSERRTELAHFVPDANLLCRYWAGQATVDEVKAAVRAEKKSASAKESLIKQVQEYYARVVSLHSENEDLRAQLANQEEVQYDLNSRIDTLNLAIDKVRSSMRARLLGIRV